MLLLLLFVISALVALLFIAHVKIERLKALKQNLEEKISSSQIHSSMVKEQFEALSSQVLTKSQSQFLELAESAFARHHTIVTHREEGIQKSLEQISTRTRELEVAREKAFSGLNQHLTTLAQTQQQLHKETSTLATALKSSQVQGRWGELQLKRALELTGMVPYCDFEEQVVQGSDDNILRPDVVIRMPNKRKIIIDAKAPLQLFMEACAATTHEAKVLGFQGHAKKVRGHIERLSQKRYWDQFAESPDFIVLFLPGETFFSSALEHDPLLLEYGVEKNVLLATPSTLLALLRVVAYGWTQAELHENALKILAEAQEMYSRLGVFTEHFKDVRRGLDKAVKAYNQAEASFNTRLLASARRLEAMKVGKDEAIQSPGALHVVEET